MRYFVSMYFPNTRFFRARHKDEIWQGLGKTEKTEYLRWYLRRTLDDWLAARVADGIIGNSPEICESFHCYYRYPAEKTCVIPGEINIARYRRVEIAKSDLNFPGISNKSRIILYVGSVQARKELPVLLRAMQSLHKHAGKNVHLVVCGEISPGAKLHLEQAMGGQHLAPYIHLTGSKNLTELAVYYSAADCFVHPGRWEGSPRTVKEAMAYGCKVIAADIFGTRVIDPDAKFLDYFRPGDHVQLAERILAVLESERRDMYHQQREYLDHRFSPTATANQYAQFYRRILSDIKSNTSYS